MSHTPDIKESIVAAIAYERQSNQFHKQLTILLPQLKEKLVLPDEDPVSALIEFTVSYIESVPGSINLVTTVSKRLGFYRYAAPFLHIAEDFFIQDLAAEIGLEALLDEAFLAHRLLEELNDHYIRHLGQPLLPVDMTEANIIVHHLLGDTLASRLEALVQFAAKRLLDKEAVWDKVRALPGSSDVIGFTSSQSDANRQIRIRTGVL